MSSLTDFQKEIVEATKASFDNLKQSHNNETFYTFALYTDESAMTIVPAANSVESLDSDCDAWTMWSTAEWKYEAWNSSNFREISAILRNSDKRKDFSSFYQQVVEDMVVALKQLDEENFFGCGDEREKVTLFVTVSDSDEAVELENSSAKVLNPPSVFERFAHRFDK